MKITWLKGNNDKKSFKILQKFGADVQIIDDLDKTDNKINELVNNDYTTIIMTNEVASFSESIIKKYGKRDDIRIIIFPQK